MSLCLSRTIANMIKCPPEVILRPLARSTQRLGTVHPKLSTQNVSSNPKRFYRAAVCTELKKPMVIQEKESEAISNDQVRVKIEAAAVNFGDILTVEGTYQEKMEPPFTPGNEFAGIITEVGPEAKIKVGTRVCGMTMGSAFAEELVTSELTVIPIPEKMSFTQAAGFVVSYGTAILALKAKANIKQGDKVLITAAAGAVGLAALDLAKNVYGAEVLGAVGGPEKCELMKKLGAQPIDYKQQSVRDSVRAIHPRGVDIVFEVVGGDVFKECFRSLATDGRLLVIGFASGKHPTVPANHMLVKNVSVIGVYWGSYKILNPELFMWSVKEVFRQFEAGKINPRVDRTFKLREVNEAFDYIRARKNMGKVIIEM